MATLNVTRTTDPSHSVFSPLVDHITFLDTAAAATLTLSGKQFDDIHISNSVVVTGSSQANQIIVNVGDFDASNWIFVGWSAADLLVIDGSSGPDTLTGSSQAD